VGQRRKPSRWDRAGLDWMGKEREVLIEGRRGRWDRTKQKYVFKTYREIYLELLHQRPQRLNEYGEPVSHSMAAVYKEAQRLGLTKKSAKLYRMNALQERRDEEIHGLQAAGGTTLHGMSNWPSNYLISKG